jgi:hypothetical protein
MKYIWLFNLLELPKAQNPQPLPSSKKQKYVEYENKGKNRHPVSQSSSVMVRTAKPGQGRQQETDDKRAKQP